MVIKLIFLAVVLYFVVKTVKSLINAVRLDGSERDRLSDPPGVRSRSEVEDAKYVDIEEGDRRWGKEMGDRR
ncbi:MAG: hypothetical protein WD275_01705 [Rhodothermales bacterium]